MESLRQSIKDAIESSPLIPCGPVYENLNKLMAELLLKSEDELSSIFHLTESHGATLRDQMTSRIAVKRRKAKLLDHTLEPMLNLLTFHSPLQSPSGVLKRLADLPAEWTVVQLTLEFDPLSRSPTAKSNRGLGLYISRLSCGNVCEKINSRGEGGMPFTTFIPARAKSGEDMSLVAAMKDIVGNANSRNRSNTFRNLSLQLEALVTEVDSWLDEWKFVLGGHLVDSDLQVLIKSAVDRLVDWYLSHLSRFASVDKVSEDSCSRAQGQAISERSLQILYLLASSSASLGHNGVYNIIFSLLKEESISKYFAKGIGRIQTKYKSKLKCTTRYPVILIVDEELDLIPLEMTTVLKGHPVTRVPSIHILSALYQHHCSKILKNGVNIKNGFYIVNPSKDLPSTEKDVITELKKCLPDWRGCAGVKPSSELFINAIENHDVFLYCGHGGGNQFLPSRDIEKRDVNAVVLLFGCSSSKFSELGGRVSMHSLFNSYLIAGCPSIVGNLWNVLDYDSNLLTNALMKNWSAAGSSNDSHSKEVQGLAVEFDSKRHINHSKEVEELAEKLDSKLKINHSKKVQVFVEEHDPKVTIKSNEPPHPSLHTTGLLEAVAKAKLIPCKYFLNSAALVVRGLPVYLTSERF